MIFYAYIYIFILLVYIYIYLLVYVYIYIYSCICDFCIYSYCWEFCIFSNISYIYQHLIFIIAGQFKVFSNKWTPKKNTAETRQEMTWSFVGPWRLPGNEGVGLCTWSNFVRNNWQRLRWKLGGCSRAWWCLWAKDRWWKPPKRSGCLAQHCRQKWNQDVCYKHIFCSKCPFKDTWQAVFCL